jgi:predicted nucleic acid-binding protein
MTTVVLDASALLRFLDNEAGAEYVERMLVRCAGGEITLLISAVNWGEVIYAIVRRKGVDSARELINRLSSLRLTVVTCSALESQEAAFFKERFKIPYADAFAGCLALRESAALITADFDFKNLPSDLVKIDFLPLKAKKSWPRA